MQFHILDNNIRLFLQNNLFDDFNGFRETQRRDIIAVCIDYLNYVYKRSRKLGTKGENV